MPISRDPDAQAPPSVAPPRRCSRPGSSFICSASHESPAGDAWLHELKHDGYRLIVVADGRRALRLISRNGYHWRDLFRALFDDIAALGRELVLDGEIAVPDFSPRPS
jgi:bifunctional non-homologous end joining protein LigD